MAKEHDLTALPTAEWQLLQEAVERFEAAWEGGQQPVVEEHLPTEPGRRLAVLIELVHVDLERRFKARLPTQVEEYLKRFPELALSPTVAAHLIAAECDLRQRHGDQLATAQVYLQRFPQYAQSLHARLRNGSAAPAGREISTDSVSKSASLERTAPQVGASARSFPAAAELPRIPGYEILQELGRGGMGVVYRARQLSLQRLVALKMLSEKEALTAEQLIRFRNEAQALARLQHPGIVQVFEIGEHAGRPYFSLELVEGGSLASKLNGSPRAPRQSAQLVMGLAQAMAAAHQASVIHRDLKPGNVLVGPKWELKVTDFGLARRLDDDSRQTRTGEVMGTPSYMAPEQVAARSDLIGPATDIYALGAILYELLTGRPPFKGATVLETLEQVQKHEAVPPRQLQPKIPRDLETICLKCLRKEPDKRYGSATDLAEDLRRFHAGEPILARPVSPWERGLRWCLRHPARAAALLLALLLSLTLLVGSLWVTVLTSNHASSLQTTNNQLVQQQKETQAALQLATSNARQAEENQQKAASNARQAHENQKKADRLAVGLLLDRGLDLCQKDKAGEGLLWLTRALKVGEEAQSTPELLQVIRTNLALWGREVRPLLGTFRHHAGFLAAMLNPTGPQARFNPRPWEMGFHALAFHPTQPLLFACENDTGFLIDMARGLQVGAQMKHVGTIFAATFSPDGATLLTTSLPGAVRFWEARSGAPLTAPSNVLSNVHYLGTAPDGKTILALQGSRVLLLDPITLAEKVPALSHASRVHVAAFSPDGGLVLAGCKDNTATLWDTATGKEITSVVHGPPAPDQEVHHVLFTPDGKTMLTAWSGARLYQVPTGKELAFVKDPRSRYWTLGVLPDSKSLLAPGQFGDNRLFALPSGQELSKAAFSPDPGGFCCSLRFNRAGDRLVSSHSSSCARVWRLPGLQPDGPQLQHEAAVIHAAFSPDDQFLVTWTGQGMLRIWQVKNGRAAPRQVPVSSEEKLLAVSPDGNLAAVASGQALELRHTWTGKQAGVSLTHPATVVAAWFSPREKILVTADAQQRVRQWHLDTGQLAAAPFHAGVVIRTLDGSSEGETILINGSVLWHAPSSKKATLSGTPRQGIAFRPDGTVLRATRNQNTVTVMDVWSGQRVGSALNIVGSADAVALNADGTLLATGSAEAAARLYRWTPSGWELSGPLLQHQDQIRLLAFSPDGKYLLTGGANPVLPLRLWTTEKGENLGLALKDIVQFAFSPDSRILATADANHTIRLWDTATAKPLGPAYPFPGVVRSLRLTSDSATLIVESGVNQFRLWKLDPRPLPGDPQRLSHWAHALTGLELDANHLVHGLSPDAWKRHQEQAGAPYP